MIAMKRKEDQNTIRTARGQTPLWELLESIVNSLLKSVSITGHKGRISIALDDDKIWFAMRKIMGNDLLTLNTLRTLNQIERVLLPIPQCPLV